MQAWELKFQQPLALACVHMVVVLLGRFVVVLQQVQLLQEYNQEQHTTGLWI
jgi:hypothetical protein